MPFSQEVVEDLLVKSARHCCVCRQRKGTKMEVHHIVPRSRGGSDDADNGIPLCFDCHAEVETYNDQHPRGRKFRASELRKHRDEWFRIIASPGVHAVRRDVLAAPVTARAGVSRSRAQPTDSRTHVAPLAARSTVEAISQALDTARGQARDHYQSLEEHEPAFRRVLTAITLRGALVKELPSLSLLLEYAHHYVLDGVQDGERVRASRVCLAKLARYYQGHATEMDGHPIGVRYYHLKASRELVDGKLGAAVANQRRAAELARQVPQVGSLKRLAHEKCVMCMRSELIADDTPRGARGEIEDLEAVGGELQKLLGSTAENREVLYLLFYNTMVKAKVCVHAGWLGRDDLGRYLVEAADWLSRRGTDDKSSIDRALLNVYRAIQLADSDAAMARQHLADAKQYWDRVRVRTYCILRLPNRIKSTLNWLDPTWLPA